MSTASETTRVSTLELFFDLVFVFTITQLTTVLYADPTPGGLLRVSLMLGVIWWMYGGYAWLTNAVALDRTAHRLLLFGGMAAYLILALAIPRAFSGGGLAFGLSYLTVVAIHATLFSRTTVERTVRAILHLAPFNIVSALLIVLAGFVGREAEYVIWALAVLLEWLTPRLSGTSGFSIAPAHFVERHGLVVLIAIGESVVAVGTGLHEDLLAPPLVGVAVLGLSLNACLWWTYFGGDDERAEYALRAARPERRPALALIAYGYAHIPLLLGVIVVAATLRKVIGQAFTPLALPQALALAGGVALFLGGEVFYRRSLGIAVGWWRTAIAVTIFVTVPLGIGVTAVAQLAALVSLLVVGFVAEGLTRATSNGSGSEAIVQR